MTTWCINSRSFYLQQPHLYLQIQFLISQQTLPSHYKDITINHTLEHHRKLFFFNAHKKPLVVKFRTINMQSAGTAQIFREFLLKWRILCLTLASYKTMLFADLQLLWLCSKVLRLQSVEQIVSWYLSHRVTQLGLLRESLNRGSGH